MATKKFIIEVEEGWTNCDKCPVAELDDYDRCLVKDLIKCLDYNLATMKIKELEEEKND